MGAHQTSAAQLADDDEEEDDRWAEKEWPLTLAEKLYLLFETDFPDVTDEDRDNFAYPAPLSEQFWRMYAEPAITILTLGVFLLETLRKLNPDYEDGERFLDLAMRSAEGDRRLYRLLAGVQPAIGDMTAEMRACASWGSKNLTVSRAKALRSNGCISGVGILAKSLKRAMICLSWASSARSVVVPSRKTSSNCSG